MASAITFLNGIGIPVFEGPTHPDCFFPGIWYERASIGYDPRVASVGDLIHDAGHLAVLPPRLRALLRPGSVFNPQLRAERSRMYEESLHASYSGDLMTAVEHFRSYPLEEATATAWSYAAAIAAGIDPKRVFESVAWFDLGSKTVANAGSRIRESLDEREHQGIVWLVKAGMCDPLAFPEMRHWLAP